VAQLLGRGRRFATGLVSIDLFGIRLHAAQLIPIPQKKIFQNQRPFPANKWCSARAAFYLTVNGLWPSLDFNDLIHRTAIRAPERDRRGHCRPHSRHGQNSLKQL